VAVLAGVSVPYIVRAESVRAQGTTGIEGQSSCYTILGDYYIHGIMGGQAFEDLEEIERELGEIVLV
jgi:hypothetical protein